MTVGEDFGYLKDFWRSREINVCTEIGRRGNTFLIQTVIQADADLITFLPGEILAEVLHQPEIWKQHHKKLKRCIRAIRQMRRMMKAFPAFGISLLLYFLWPL